MEGGCLCGEIRYRIDGRARRTTHCHCLHCRRSSGAAFITWVECNAAEFEITSGTPSRYESRPQVTRQFCGKCGTQLTYQHAETRATIDVSVCSLDDPAGVEPEDHLWCDRMLPWLKMEDGLPRYALERSRA